VANKKTWLGILVITLVFGMMVVRCDNGTTNDGTIAVTFNDITANGSSSQTTTELTLTFSQAITGLSVGDITLSGVAGVDKGTLTNSGLSYTLSISGFSTGGTLSVTVAKSGYTIHGSPKTAAIFYSAGENTEKTPEEMTVAERWQQNWVDPGEYYAEWNDTLYPPSKVTINNAVDADGVCTITVGGTAEPGNWLRWRANCSYSYSARKDTRYTYVFEAWTTGPDRTVTVSYFWDEYYANLYGDVWTREVNITDTRTTYSIEGKTVPKAGIFHMSFQCADQLGTFYVKIISITESSDIIPAKWQGTYGEDRLLSILGSGALYWVGWNVPDGSISGATIVNGGICSAPGVTGEWVYLAIDGVNRGIIAYYSPAVLDYQGIIGMGFWGANELMSMMESFGGTISPYPNISGFPGFPIDDYGFWAVKKSP
jgi:hypothetical protein